MANYGIVFQLLENKGADLRNVRKNHLKYKRLKMLRCAGVDVPNEERGEIFNMIISNLIAATNKIYPRVPVCYIHRNNLEETFISVKDYSNLTEDEKKNYIAYHC